MTKSQLFIAGGVSLLLGVLILCFSSGAGDAPVEVAGVVYLDSQPLANADVFFIGDVKGSGEGDGQARRAHGHTDENGRYELLSGVMPGSYRVVVRAIIGGDQQAIVPGLGSDGLDIAQLEAASSAVETAQQAASHNYGYRSRRQSANASSPKPLPPVYSSAEQTVLTIGVPEDGTGTADLQLSLDRVAMMDQARN